MKWSNIKGRYKFWSIISIALSFIFGYLISINDMAYHIFKLIGIILLCVFIMFNAITVLALIENVKIKDIKLINQDQYFKTKPCYLHFSIIFLFIILIDFIIFLIKRINNFADKHF